MQIVGGVFCAWDSAPTLRANTPFTIRCHGGGPVNPGRRYFEELSKARQPGLNDEDGMCAWRLKSSK